MLRFGFCVFTFALAPVLLAAQVSGASSGVMRLGPGVTPPRVLRKVEPEYSPIARADRIQGSVVLQIVVDEQGRPQDITVISPLGFGLDERAEAAVAKWEFEPGRKDGRPVKILATVEVHFRFPSLRFDEKAERQRTAFNLNLKALQGTDTKAVDRAVASMVQLSQQKFARAMCLVGVWEMHGEHVAKNSEDGLALIQKAAAKNHGPALYEIALLRIDGRDLAKDVEKGLEEMRQAAILGSLQAQFYMGNRYENGDGVLPELDRARRYFRLCAAQGVAMCQYRLARLLFTAADRSEREYVEAVAWFQLAGEHGLREAQDAATQETQTLTPEQVTWVKSLKAQLLRQ